MKKSWQSKVEEGITYDEESALWINSTFGSSNPNQKIYTFVYNFGVQFFLRAGLGTKGSGIWRKISTLCIRNGGEYRIY